MAKDVDGSFQTAQRINTTNRSLTLSGAIGKSDQLDFYRINLTRRSGLALTLSQLKANADVALFNGKKQIIQQSNRPKKMDEAFATSLEPGTYYIRISARSKRDSTRYKLSLFCSDLAINSSPAANTSLATTSLQTTGSGVSQSTSVVTNPSASTMNTTNTTNITSTTNTTSTISTTNPPTSNSNGGSFVVTPKTIAELEKMKLAFNMSKTNLLPGGLVKNPISGSNSQQLALYWQRLFNSTLSGTP
jgi:hypothetical protein